jgi:hypothetical protein
MTDSEKDRAHSTVLSFFNDERQVLRGPLSGVRVKFLQKARRKFTLIII